MQLRSFAQYRPSEPLASSRGHREGLLLALIGLVLGAALFGSCGSGSKADAASWLPDLKSLGYTQQPQNQPLINGDVGSAVALYSRTTPPGTARVDVALYKNSDEATTAFGTTSQQLSALPPGLFGANAVQGKGEPLKKGDAAVSYVTQAADASGNRVWTDTYRFGDTVVVSFVIAKDEASATPVREAIADQLAKK